MVTLDSIYEQARKDLQFIDAELSRRERLDSLLFNMTETVQLYLVRSNLLLILAGEKNG